MTNKPSASIIAATLIRTTQKRDDSVTAGGHHHRQPVFTLLNLAKWTMDWTEDSVFARSLAGIQQYEQMAPWWIDEAVNNGLIEQEEEVWDIRVAALQKRS